MFTRIYIANLAGSDSPPLPAPVHMKCWEDRGVRQGYTRVEPGLFKGQFVYRGKWYTGIGIKDEVQCWLCKEIIW